MALRYTCVSPARLVQPEGVVVSTSPESQELSFLDSSPTMLALYPCSAWFFKHAMDESAVTASLARTLAIFPMSAGRLVRPRAGEHTYHVLLNGAGGWLDVFDCSGTLADFDGYADWSVVGRHTQRLNNKTPPPFIPKLEPEAVLAGTSPLFACRITRLACGGSVMGCTFTHCIGDGASVLHFFGRWSETHAQMFPATRHNELTGKMSTLAAWPFKAPPVWDRDMFVKAATTVPEGMPAEVVANGKAHAAQHAVLMAAATPLRCLLRLAKMALSAATRKRGSIVVRVPAKAIATARVKAASAGMGSLSDNDLCVGLAWAAMRSVRSRGVNGRPRLPGQHSITQVLDLRGMLPGLSPSYVGNAVCTVGASIPATDGATADVLQLAAAVRGSMNDFMNSTAVFDQMRASKDAANLIAKVRSTSQVLFADGFVTSWNLPIIWAFELGAGPTVWWNGMVVPSATWSAIILCARPDVAPGDYLIALNPPKGKMKQMQEAADAMVRDLAAPVAIECPPKASA